MHFPNEEDLLTNVKKAGKRCGCFTQLPDNPCYSAPCVPTSAPPAWTARNCDIYGGVWEGSSWKTDFWMSLKYLLEDKREKEEGDGILHYLELHFRVPFHYFIPKRSVFLEQWRRLVDWCHKQVGRTSESLVKIKIKSIDCNGKFCMSKPQRNSGWKLCLSVRYCIKLL